MRTSPMLIVGLVVATFVIACRWCAAGSEQPPWPADVPGFVPVQPGEHPRLLFRNTDLPALRKRAETPEGQAILKRLRVTLNGTDGESLPSELGMNTKPAADGAGPLAERPAGHVFTISHVAGYGFLYQITGDKKYADLGRKAMDAALAGYRGRDARYSFRQPYGALRAGPSLGWAAVGYDLCYSGWDEDYRRKVAREIQEYNEGPNCSLAELVRGSRHFPASNHWGMQVGGGALALLAIMGDPGVDQQKIVPLLEESRKAMIRNVTEGFGDGGYFAEGDGTGSMASHIVYLTALQAWKTAAGKDFISPRPNVRWTALKWFLLTVPKGDLGNLRNCFPQRGGYPHNIWARDGLSGGGYFCIGYGAVLPEERLGIWWWYHHYKINQWDEKNGTPWDTVSVYPHHSILAFINTPFGEKPIPMSEVVPRCVRDSKHGFYAFRNRWQDENDIVISQLVKRSPARFAHGPEKTMTIWHHGKREQWGTLPANPTHWEPMADGSAIVGAGEHWVAIDFSGASGADGMIVLTGAGATGGQSVTAGGRTYWLKFLTDRAEPAVRVEGEKILVGKQTISFDKGRLVLGVTAGPWKPRPLEGQPRPQ